MTGVTRQFLCGLFCFVGWLAGLSESEWISRTVDAWYLFLPAALVGAGLSLPASLWLMRSKMPGERFANRLSVVAALALGAAGSTMWLTSLANRVGAPTETFVETHRVVRTGHLSGRGYIPIVIVQTARGTDHFRITETERAEIQPNQQVRLLLRPGNLGFARFARVDLAR